jgi:hypothetical protein
MSCSNCNKTFSSRQNLDYHVTNKVCQKFDKKCKKCGHIFSSKVMLKYHVDNDVCEKKIKKKIQLKKDHLEQYEVFTKDELILKVVHLEGENQALKENPMNVNNVNNVQNNLMFFPSAYGKEDIDYICKK